ncbi:MAG: hypothetical protein ACQETJ_12275, partial [Bacteroidota bacterium]
HIYIAGFWSSGSNPFVIDTVFLTNSDEYDPPTIHVNDSQGNEITKLEEFSYQLGHGPSDIQELVVSGTNLNNDITINASSGFEISQDTLNGFFSNIVLQTNDGVVEETVIYVRMIAELSVGNIDGNLNLSSSETSNKTISLSGIVDEKTSIDGLKAPGAKVLAVHYFTLTGQRVQNIENKTGIFIEKKILSDGRVVTTKIQKNY